MPAARSFVSFLRLTEWRDVHAQLAGEIAEQGWKWDAKLPAAIDAARYRTIHEALLAGLLGNVGLKDAEGAGVPRRARHPLSSASGVRAREEGAEMGARGGARRDLAPVRALRGEDRARVDRDGRWSPASRANISSRTGTRIAARSSRASACSCTDSRSCRAAACRTAASTPAVAREVFIREALVPGALATKRRIPRSQPPARRRGRGARAQGAAPGRSGRRCGDRRFLRRSGCRRAFTRGRRSSAGARKPSAQDPRLLFLTRETLMRHAAAHVTEALFPETDRDGRREPAASLPVRAGPSAGRPDADGAARAAQPGRCRPPHVARPRHAPRQGAAAPEGAAEGVAQPPRLRCRTP